MGSDEGKMEPTSIEDILDDSETDDKRMTRKVHEAIVERSVFEKNLIEDSDYGSFEELYLTVRKFIEDFLDLVEDTEYDVLTAKVLESWLIDKFNEIGYIFFIGPHRSGKTRALEVLAAICYNPLMGAYISRKAIPRILDAETITLFIDEIQQYLSTDRDDFLAILNAGQRRGQKAIILVPGGDDGWHIKEFEVFGSKFFASTEETTKTLASRCIIIPMVKNARQIPMKIDGDRAAKIRLKLEKFKNDMKDKWLEDTVPIFHKLEFRDYRNIETFLNLIAVTPKKFRSRLLKYAKAIDQQIAEEDGINVYADVYKAIEKVWKRAKGGKIAIRDIVAEYNLNRPEQEWLSNKAIGSIVNTMGLRRKTRITGGWAGRYASANLMKRLKRRYGGFTRTLNDEEMISEESEENEAPRGMDGPASLKCYDCKQEITDDSKILWKGNLRLCSQCATIRKNNLKSNA